MLSLAEVGNWVVLLEDGLDGRCVGQNGVVSEGIDVRSFNDAARRIESQSKLLSRHTVRS